MKFVELSTEETTVCPYCCKLKFVERQCRNCHPKRKTKLDKSNAKK